MMVAVLVSLLLWAVVLMAVGTGWWPIIVWLLTAISVAVMLRQIDPDWPMY